MRRNDTKIYGQKLKQKRYDMNISQTKFGLAAGMGISNIQRIERSRVSSVQSTSVPDLARAMGMSLDDFKAMFAVPEGDEIDPMKLRAELFDTVEKLAMLEGKTRAGMMRVVADELDPPEIEVDHKGRAALKREMWSLPECDQWNRDVNRSSRRTNGES